MKPEARAPSSPRRTFSAGCSRRLAWVAMSAAVVGAFYWQQADSDERRSHESVSGSVVRHGQLLPGGTIEFACQIVREGETRFPDAVAAVHNGFFSIASDQGLVPGVYLVRVVAAEGACGDTSAADGDEAAGCTCGGEEGQADSATVTQQNDDAILVVVRKNHRNHFEIVLPD